MNHPHLVNLNLDPDELGLATDLYQLTMTAGFLAQEISGSPAVFEMFVRRLPPNRSFLVCAGLEQAIDALVRLRFSREQVAAIRMWPVFAEVDPRFFETLESFRFGGDVWAVPEGTVVFANEPILRVSAPLAQAQMVETLLLATIGYATSVASKAARIVVAAQGRGLIDFGARRGHGLQASMIAARSAYLAGFQGTSQAEAAHRLGIPAFGTMAHSWVQAFDDEPEAFRAFAATFPRSTLLVDTFHTPTGVRHAAQIEPPVRAIRIDSGDLLESSREARVILDSHHRGEIRILASGDLDEFKITRLVDQGAPIDDFGVGTELINCADAPALSLVYKLCELNGVGRLKLSQDKRGLPFAKQVDRRCSADGRLAEDWVIQETEVCVGTPLLRPVMVGGQVVDPLPTLKEVREHCKAQLATLPPEYHQLDGPIPASPVRISENLIREADRLSQLRRAGSSQI